MRINVSCFHLVKLSGVKPWRNRSAVAWSIVLFATRASIAALAESESGKPAISAIVLVLISSCCFANAPG